MGSERRANAISPLFRQSPAPFVNDALLAWRAALRVRTHDSHATIRPSKRNQTLPKTLNNNSAPAAAADKRAAAVAAGVTAGALSMLASPLAAQAAVTPSLRNLIYSLVAGGVVLGGIAVAVTAVSSFDPVKRG